MLQGRLSSWKEIAAYLECDESTARRWERESGLPVHRIGNKGGTTVRAYTEEIDGWIRCRGSNVVRTNVRDEEISTPQSSLVAHHGPETPGDNQCVQTAAHASSGPPSALPSNTKSTQTSHSQRRYLYAGAASFFCLAFVLGITLFSRYPQSARASKSTVSGETASGQSLIDIDKIDNSAAPDQTEEETALHLKAFVKQTQIWEMLTLYSAPWSCDARNVQRYWLAGSKAFIDVGESASRLNERGWHYGYDSRLLDFQFRYVRISPDGSTATVGTREHWWLPLYTRNEEVASKRNPDQGPYEIEYLLKRVNGFWYISSTTTPYLQWKPRQITCRNWPEEAETKHDTGLVSRR